MSAWTPFQFFLACAGVMLTGSGIAITIATLLVKFGLWGGNKNAVLDAVQSGIARVENLVEDFREEIRQDFKALSLKVDRLAETVAGHSEAITSLKQERSRGR